MTDFNQFWFKYPKDLCHNKKGSKFTAEKAWEKLKDEERERCLFDTEALVRSDRRDPTPDRWPHVSTYINQKYWERDLPSSDEITAKIEAKICSKCSTAEVIGPKFNVCGKCLEPKTARLKMMSILRDIGVAMPGQSLQELSESCREYLKQNGAYGNTVNKMTSSLKPADSGNQ